MYFRDEKEIAKTSQLFYECINMPADACNDEGQRTPWMTRWVVCGLIGPAGPCLFRAEET
jgi:hypothetical protein